MKQFNVRNPLLNSVVLRFLDVLLPPIRPTLHDGVSLLLPVRVGTVLGDDELDFAQSAHGHAVASGCELKQLALLLVAKLVHHFPEITTEISLYNTCPSRVRSLR